VNFGLENYFYISGAMSNGLSPKSSSRLNSLGFNPRVFYSRSLLVLFVLAIGLTPFPAFILSNVLNIQSSSSSSTESSIPLF
jgi:hypothetical protein